MAYVRSYIAGMATRAHEPAGDRPDGETDPGHDAFVRAKVRRGLEQSRDRASMIPIEQAWRDLKLER